MASDVNQEFMNLSERDREKIMVLMRSFATGEDLAAFIAMTQAVHKEQEHRAWAWGVIKKVAAGIVLGARVPIILTSRADSKRTRMFSCGVAMALSAARREGQIK